MFCLLISRAFFVRCNRSSASCQFIKGVTRITFSMFVLQVVTFIPVLPPILTNHFKNRKLIRLHCFKCPTCHSYFKSTLVRLCGIAEKWDNPWTSPRRSCLVKTSLDNPSFTTIYWHFVKSKHVYIF